MNYLKFYQDKMQTEHLGIDLSMGLKEVSNIVDTSLAQASQRFTNMDQQSVSVMEKTGKLEKIGSSIAKRTAITAALALTYVGFLYIRPFPNYKHER